MPHPLDPLSNDDLVTARGPFRQSTREAGDAAGPTGFRDDWGTARWMVPAEPIGPGEWACFRRVCAIDAPLRRPRLRVACDSKYWLWIDGRLAVYEGQLKRGPTPSDTYFDELELPELLAAGQHTIAVLVWYFGKHGFSHNSSGRCGLILQLDDADAGQESGRSPQVASGGQWRSIRHPAYSAGVDPLPNFRLAEPNVAFDAGLEPARWQEPLFDDSGWPSAVDAGAPAAAPWGRLVRRPVPMFRDHGETPLLKPMRPLVATGEPIVCPLPFNCHAHPTFEIDAPTGGITIGVRTDNYLGGGAPNVRATYVTRAGRQSYESLGWMNGHALHFDVPAGVKIHRLGYRRTSYAAGWTGRFACDDPSLNKLYAKSCRTLDVCMRDSYMDCPDRERAQWWGDVVIQMGSAFYACDATDAPALGRKAMRELVAWQRDDATLYSPVPAGAPRRGREDVDRLAGCWDFELPAQMLASIGPYGFWTYYRYTGDVAAIAEVYPAVRRYLAVWRVDSRTGVVEPRAGGWDWVDWGANVDAAVSVNAWYALALASAADMADLLCLPDDAAGYRALHRRLRGGFQAAFWCGDHFRGDDTLPLPDDRAQAMAVIAGFVSRSQRDGVLAVLDTQRHAGPYMEKYIVEALFKLDEPTRALKRLVERYAEQLDGDISTLWEGWSIGDATWGGGTYNHAWSGGAITLLQQYVAGIEPITPGFARFRVAPQLGPLRSLRSTAPTPTGEIRVHIDLDACRARLRVPDGTVAEFHFRGVQKTLEAGTHRIALPSKAGPGEGAVLVTRGEQSCLGAADGEGR